MDKTHNLTSEEQQPKRFIITELQYVLAVREIEANDEDEAWEKYDAGEGREVGRNGEVTDSMRIGAEEQ